MAKMIILITPKIEKGLEVAEAWEAAGAPGVTLIDSHGLHNLRQKGKTLEIPLFVSLASVMRQVEESNQTLLSVVDDDAVDHLIDIACEILGDLINPNSGVAFVINVESIYGMDPSKRQPQ